MTKKFIKAEATKLRDKIRNDSNVFTENAINEAVALSVLDKIGISSNDLTCLVIKSHLAIEALINKILLLVLPNGSMLEKYRFLSKLEILEAINIFEGNATIVSRIKSLNNFRNKYAHNFNYRATNLDIEQFVGYKLRSNKQKAQISSLIKGLGYIIGYLGAIQAKYEATPFFAFCNSHFEIFNKDTGFHYCEVRKKYNKLGYEEFLKVLQYREKKS